MGKNRKSVVNKELQDLRPKRDLPTPEETSKAVEETTSGSKSGKRGRPAARHRKVRYTTLLEADHRDKLKLIALRDHRQLHDIFEEAISAYLKAYEAEHGKLSI